MSGGEYVSAAAKFRVISKTKHKEAQSKRNGRSLLFSFSQRNGFALRKIAIVCFGRSNRLVLNESLCYTLSRTITISEFD